MSWGCRGFAPCRTQTVFGLHKCALRVTDPEVNATFCSALTRQSLAIFSTPKGMNKFEFNGRAALRIRGARDGGNSSMPKLDERIATLQQQLQQLKAKQQRIAARQKALESRRNRKADTRRKILVGAVVLARIDQGELNKAQLHRWLDEALTRPDDRALFDLTALSAN